MSCAPLRTTEDRLLGGRVRLEQPAAGYRAGIDPVLLAAAVPAAPDQHVLDLGCGPGAAALCLAARVPGVRVTGVEVLPEIAALAEMNGRDVGLRVVVADATAWRTAPGELPFDHVLANPPYFAGGTPSPRAVKATATHGAAHDLAAWAATAAAALSPGGTFTLILTAERLGDALAAFGARFGAVRVLPIAPRAELPALRVLVQGIKGRRTPLVLLPPLTLHGPGQNYSAAAEAVLRDAAPLILGA